MKLQKIHAYTYGGKDHHRYVVTIPEELIDELKWQAGSELEVKQLKDKIQISFIAKPVKNPKPKNMKPKMPYSEFRDKIQKALEYKDTGMSWSDLRDILEFEQVVPNNKWVRQLERDIGLKRIRSMDGVIWRISHV